MRLKDLADNELNLGEYTFKIDSITAPEVDKDADYQMVKFDLIVAEGPAAKRHHFQTYFLRPSEKNPKVIEGRDLGSDLTRLKYFPHDFDIPVEKGADATAEALQPLVGKLIDGKIYPYTPKKGKYAGEERTKFKALRMTQVTADGQVIGGPSVGVNNV